MAARGKACFSIVNYMKYCTGDNSCKPGCLVCRFFPLILGFLCVLMDFPIQIATIRIGLSSICFKGSQVDLPTYMNFRLQSYYCIYLSKKCKR